MNPHKRFPALAGVARDAVWFRLQRGRHSARQITRLDDFLRQKVTGATPPVRQERRPQRQKPRHLRPEHPELGA